MPLVIDNTNFRDVYQEHQHRLGSHVSLPNPGILPRHLDPRRGELRVSAPVIIKPIPRSQWPRLIEEGKGTWLSDLTKDGAPIHDQGKTNYCWCHGPARALEHLFQYQYGKAQSFSAEAIGVPLTGGRNIGGFPDDAVRQIIKEGTCPQEYWPQNDLKIKNAKPGWDTIRRFYRFNDWVDLHGFDLQMSFALLRIPVPLPLYWWGHEVCQTDPVMFDNGTFGVKFDNSWGPNWGDNGTGILTEAKATAEEGFLAPISLTIAKLVDVMTQTSNLAT
jgi:hypothetical protein